MHKLCDAVICYEYILCETSCMRPLLWQQSLALKDLTTLYIVRLYNDSRSAASIFHSQFHKTSPKSLTLQHPHCFALQSTCKVGVVGVSTGPHEEGCKFKCYWPTGLAGSPTLWGKKKKSCRLKLSTINLAI